MAAPSTQDFYNDPYDVELIADPYPEATIKEETAP